jgi:hypothetical protein
VNLDLFLENFVDTPKKTNREINIDKILSNYILDEESRAWFRGEVLTEETESKGLQELKKIFDKPITKRDIEDVFQRTDDEDIEDILRIVNSGNNVGEIFFNVYKVIMETDPDTEMDWEEKFIEIKDNPEYLVKYFINIPGRDDDLTIIYFDYFKKFAVMNVDKFYKLSNPEKEQDEYTYIDWFDPTRYETVEDAIQAAIRIGTQSKKKDLSYGDMFPQERTYVDVKPNEIRVDIEEDPILVDFLNGLGYEIVDYKDGTARREGSDRVTSIGKIKALKKNKEMLERYTERLGGQMKDFSNLQLVFTYNPRDIAEASTNRGWTSCADFKGGGPAANQLPNKIKFGGMLVYLINKNDKNIKRPIARLTLRRFIDKTNGTFIMLPEYKCYGAKVYGLTEKVLDIVQQSNKVTSKDEMGIFKDAEGGYSDTDYNKGFINVTIDGESLEDKIIDFKHKGSPSELMEFVKEKLNGKVWDKLIETDEELYENYRDLIFNILRTNKEKTDFIMILLSSEKVIENAFNDLPDLLNYLIVDKDNYEGNLEKLIRRLKEIYENMKEDSNDGDISKWINDNMMMTKITPEYIEVLKSVFSGYERTERDRVVMAQKLIEEMLEANSYKEIDKDLEQLKETIPDKLYRFTLFVKPVDLLEPETYSILKFYRLMRIIKVLKDKKVRFDTMAFEHIFNVLQMEDFFDILTTYNKNNSKLIKSIEEAFDGVIDNDTIQLMWDEVVKVFRNVSFQETDDKISENNLKLIDEKIRPLKILYQINKYKKVIDKMIERGKKSNNGYVNKLYHVAEVFMTDGHYGLVQSHFENQDIQTEGIYEEINKAFKILESL